MRLSRLLFLYVFVLTLVACAAPRYLTIEQDTEMRDTCEPAGCVAIPLPLFEKIQEALKSFISV